MEIGCFLANAEGGKPEGRQKGIVGYIMARCVQKGKNTTYKTRKKT